MAMVIMNNGAAMQALHENDKNSNKLSKDLQKVASGMKINGASDGAAEYAVSEKMRVMIRSLGQDIENAKKGIDLVKIAEEGMQNIVDQLRDMKAMAIDSANDHNSDADRAILQKEFASRMAGIDNIAATTNYNGKILMDGRYWYKEYDDIISEKGSTQANTLMTSLKLDKNQSANFNFVWGKPQLTKSKIMLGGVANSLSPIVEGEVTNLVFDGSASKYKENVITGLFPEPVGVNKDFGYGDIIGYAPSYYKEVVKEANGKYNIYSKTQTDIPFQDKPNYIINKQYASIPPIGTEVTTTTTVGNRNEKNWTAIIKQETGTGRIIAEGITVYPYLETNYKYTSVEIDFDNAKVNGKEAVVPNDFHGQGFSISRNFYKYEKDKNYQESITSIIFDATLDLGDSQLLTTPNPTNTVEWTSDPIEMEKRRRTRGESLNWTAYVIGIKGAGSVDDLGMALIDGLRKAQEPWGDYYKENGYSDPLADDMAITKPMGNGMSVMKYGSTYVLKMLNGGEDRLVITNGVIGMSGTIGKLETTPEPDPPEPDPPEPDPPEPDPPEPDPPEPDPPEPDPPEPDPPKPDDNEQGYKGRRFEGNPLIIHYGPKQNQHLRVYINDMHTKAMGLKDVVIDPLEKAREAMGKLDGALDYALNEITRMGAYQKKLQYTIDNNTTAEENVTSAESVIRDADMAKSMMAYVKDNILTQTSQAMLAQANQNSGAVLRLLQ